MQHLALPVFCACWNLDQTRARQLPAGNKLDFFGKHFEHTSWYGRGNSLAHVAVHKHFQETLTEQHLAVFAELLVADILQHLPYSLALTDREQSARKVCEMPHL